MEHKKRTKVEHDRTYSVKDNLDLGKSASFIQTMRRQSPQRYKKYREYGDGDFAKGFGLIWEEYAKSLERFTEVYHYLRENRIISMAEFYARTKTSNAYSMGRRMAGQLPNDPFKAIKEFDAASEGFAEQASQFFAKRKDTIWQ